MFFHNRGKDSVGEEVTRPYTPTTLDSDVGYFELVIKVWAELIRRGGRYSSLFFSLLFQAFTTSSVFCSFSLRLDVSPGKDVPPFPGNARR